MIEVYAGAGGLALLVIAWVIFAARRPGVDAPDGADVSAAIYLDRDRELIAEARGQGLGEADAERLRTELAANLASELQGDDASPVPAKPTTMPPLAPVIGSALAAGVLGLALYAHWGEPDAPFLARVITLMHDPATPATKLAAAEASLARRATRHPRDGSALFYQGYVRLVMRDYRGADAIFSALHERMGAVPNVDIAWAQASYMAAGQRVTAATRAIIDRVLAAHPEHVTMLELLATDALRRSDFEAAEGYLKRAAAKVAPGADAAAFREALALAQTRLGDAQAPVRDPAESPAGAPPAITAHVTLSASFEAAPQTPVFVIVRAPSGAGPPLAVRRLTVADLPTAVTLTDADAMLPGRTLSQQERLRLLARVSLTGTPTRSAGDLESRPVTARPGDDPVRLHVEHVVP